MLQRRKQIKRNKNNFIPESFEILGEMDKFQEKRNRPKLIREETENQKCPVTTENFE